MSPASGRTLPTVTEPREPSNPGQPDESTPAAVGAGLTDTEHAMLVLEQSWRKYAGAKETRVRAEFNMPITRYYQVLAVLIDKPEALAAHPTTVSRLSRLRDARREQRSADRNPNRGSGRD